MTDTPSDALTYAVADLPATAADVRDWLASEDWDDQHAGRIGPSHLRAFMRSRLGLLNDFDPMKTTTMEGDRTDNGAVHSSPRPPPSPCGAPYGVQPTRTPDSPYRVVPEPTSRSEGSHRPDRHLALEPSPEPSGTGPPIGRRILREVLVLQGRARRIGGARGNPSRRTCSRIWSMTSGSVTSAITRSRPPQ